MHCVSIRGKLQPQDHRMSFCNSQVCSPETQTSQNRQQQQQLILQQVLDLQFSSLAGSVIQKHCGLIGLCHCVLANLSIYLYLTVCLIYVFISNSKFLSRFKKNCVLWLLLCAWEGFSFFLLIFPPSFVLFYGIDCLLAGSKVRQITSSLRGGLTGTWK